MPFLRLSLALLASAVVAAHVGEPTDLKSALEEKRKELHIVGAVVGIYVADEPAIEWALGEADADNARPMTVDCFFRVGSISKVFVGTTLLALVDEGLLSVDDPVSKYLPEVPGGEHMTIRHLGSHRSGLFNHIESREVKERFSATPEKLWAEEELLAFCYNNKPYFPPGEKHHYSNANTVLLAKIIEIVTKDSWKRQVKKRVFEPLGMTHTSIPESNDMPTPHAEGYAFGTKEGPFFHRGTIRYRVTSTSPTWWGPAGSVISTLGDLRKAAKPIATGALLSDKSKAILHDWTPADQVGYEYGFHIEKRKGFIGHDGDVPGYQSVMYYSPERDATVIVLANVYGWSLRDMPASRLAWEVVKRRLSREDAGRGGSDGD